MTGDGGSSGYKLQPETKVKGTLWLKYDYTDYTVNMESKETEEKQRQLRFVKFLLDELKVNINEKNNVGDTPIHIAAQMGKTLLVNHLLKEGADIYIANNRGLTARDDDSTG